MAIQEDQSKNIVKSLSSPKLFEYGGYVFPGETSIPKQKKYHDNIHKRAVIEEGRRITSAMIRDKDYKVR